MIALCFESLKDSDFSWPHSRQGDFSFDALFGNLVNDLLPSFLEEEADSGDGHGNIDGLANGHLRGGQSDASRFSQVSSAPFFPEVDGLLSLFKDSCKELIDLRKQVSLCVIGFFLSFHPSENLSFC